MWLTFFFLGCGGLRDYIPQDAVLSPAARAAFHSDLPDPTASGKSTNTVPVLPFTVFGVKYKHDIVLQTEDPSLNMLELILLEVPSHLSKSGETWLVKSSDIYGEQQLYGYHSELRKWMPEINVARHSNASLSVTSWPEANRRKVELSFRAADGRKVEATVDAPLNAKPAKRRNSSTFNHSKTIASALLDVSKKSSRVSAELRFNGIEQRFKKVLGIVPVKVLLEQTQGGVTSASMRVEENPAGGVLIQRPLPETTWAVPGKQSCQIEEQWLVCKEQLSKVSYRFFQGGLVEAKVHNWRGERMFHLRLETPLPDLSVKFEGRQTRRFVADVGGLDGAGTGTVQAYWEGQKVMVDIEPRAPSWFADRPMQSEINFIETGGYTLSTQAK